MLSRPIPISLFGFEPVSSNRPDAASIEAFCGATHQPEG
jgi:hypothetical protein